MYVNHTDGPYSVAYDTPIIHNELIINRSGNCDDIDALVIRINGRHAYWINNIYIQIR